MRMKGFYLKQKELDKLHQAHELERNTGVENI